MRLNVEKSASNQLFYKKNISLAHTLAAGVALMLLQAHDGFAASGAQVETGDISFNRPAQNQLVVTQGRERGIINWQDFDIAKQESVRFNQPSARSITLNRIRNGRPTNIEGNLSANGRVVVVNPSGVIFGAGSTVNVAGIVASTADIKSADFLAGKTNFSIAGKPDASIVNQGTITATEGGLVALVAPSVRNDGVIQAKSGTVVLGSAKTASIDFYGDGLYSFAAGEQVDVTPLDANGNPVKAAVSNTGTISATGGTVLLTANAAKNVVDHAINTTGIIEATSARVEGGSVVLDGGEGNVRVAGIVNVSGKAAGQTGGNITVTGKNIELADAAFDASGNAGGGKVRIGGDYQGQGTLAHAKTVKANAGTTINVSAIESGNGGTSVVWSDESTKFSGKVVGTGGAKGGNGGLAEVSSKGKLGFDGSADLHASNGVSGTLLLDPGDLFIGNVGDFSAGGDEFVRASSIISTLNTGTNVSQSATNNVNVTSAINWTGSGALTLTAGNNMLINADIISGYNGGTGALGGITLNAGNNISLTGANISAGRGTVALNGVNVALNNGTVSSNTGNVVINNSGVFSSNTAGSVFNGAANAGGSVSLRQSAAGSIQNALTAIGTLGTGGGTLQLGSGTWNEQIFITQSRLALLGNGFNNTFIQAPAASTNPIISVNGANNVRISGIGVVGGTTGIRVINSNNFDLKGVIIADASDAGLRLVNVNGADIGGGSIPTANIFLDNLIGIDTVNSSKVLIHGNTFYMNGAANGYGVRMNGGQSNSINTSYFADGQTAISLTNVAGIPIFDNLIAGVFTGFDITGGSSIVISNNDASVFQSGLTADGVRGMNVTNNRFNGSGGGFDAGLNINNGTGVNLTGNTINDFRDAIVVNASRSTSIINNTLPVYSVDGVRVTNSVGTLVNGNTISGSGNGAGINFATGNYNFTASNNTINDRVGINVVDSSLFFILGNQIDTGNTGTAGIGLNLNNAQNGIIGRSTIAGQGNTFSNNAVGIESLNSSMNIVQGNTFTNNPVAMRFTNDQPIAIDANTISGSVNGIILANVIGAPVTNNIITGTTNGISATGGSSVVIDNNSITGADTAVSAGNVDGLKVTNNSITGSGSNGVAVVGGTNAVIAGNTVSNYFNGININGTTDATISGNTLTTIANNAISLINGVNTLIDGNIITTAGNGINLLQSNVNATLQNNQVSNSGNGILVQGGTTLFVLNNTLDSNTVGANIDSINDTAVENNTFSNNGTGLLISNSDNVRPLTNTYTGNGIAISLVNSDNAILNGEIFTNNTVAVNLDNSQNARLEELTMNMPSNGTGIQIINGSGGTIVRGLNITGGNIGVLLDGAGSSMQFESNTSQFSGQSNYFILQNNAMLGDTLDASAQIFGGTRASDFTVAQRDAAEAITTDVEDLPGRGNVFYKDFPSPTPTTTFSTTGLDSFLQFREFIFPQGLFSYAGRTIDVNPARTPLTFAVDAVNLSLLNPTAGGTPITPSGAVTPAALAALTPAAGGNAPAGDVQNLAELEPAAGGGDAGACGNNFLGSGFNIGFNIQTCTVTQQ